ncbi:MAG: YcnI family protein [Thermostichales cyanobacterium DRC_bins_46]
MFKLLLMAGVMLLPMTARAHVTVSPSEAPANSHTKLSFRVPHGCQGSPTVRLRLQIPEGVTGVKPQVHPLWQIRTTMRPLAQPYQSHGKTISETVAEVIWEGGSLPDNLMDEFHVAVKLPNQPGQMLAFPVVQECEQGIYRWIQVPQAGEDPHSLPEPAPMLKLTQGHGHHH